ncbi:MAG: Sortase family protein [Microgenomates group bacterium GW2011_GWC1_49_7]|nr:MAG: Sortase family protein [Microgenomates group bacterium GW2011_GWC1_49_7]
MLYRYVKAPPVSPRRRASRRVSFGLMGLGGIILAWVAWPILSFSLASGDLFSQTVTPIAESKNLSPVVFAAGDPGIADFTNANAWFPTAPQKKVVTAVNSYTISIPKLKIVDAEVLIGVDDLSKSLIHYGGTGLPGEYGNTVIFGHSTLPQFFNPKSYKTIFSTLPTLEEGDQIDVTYDGISYTYIVYELTVSDPSDLSALEQRFDDSYLTLITCVPPGTYWQRLHVKAKLERPL